MNYTATSEGHTLLSPMFSDVRGHRAAAVSTLPTAFHRILAEIVFFAGLIAVLAAVIGFRVARYKGIGFDVPIAGPIALGAFFLAVIAFAGYAIMSDKVGNARG